MREVIEVAPRLAYCIGSGLYSLTSTVCGAVSSAASSVSSRVEKFIDDHEVALTRYTAVYEAVTEVTSNIFAFSLIGGAMLRDNSWLGFPLEVLWVTVPLALYSGAAAARAHKDTNANHEQHGHARERTPFTLGKKIYVAVILVGDFIDHTGAAAQTGIFFVRYQAGGDGLSSGERMLTYLGITALSALNSVSEIRICAANMLAVYRDGIVKEQEDVKPDFFTWFTTGYGGLNVLIGAYTTFGLTLDSITGATPLPRGGLSISGWISVFTLGLHASASNIIVHTFVAIGYQNNNFGFRDHNVLLNKKGKAVGIVLKSGDFNSHLLAYSASLEQLRLQFLPSSIVTIPGAVALDILNFATAGTGCIAETRVCFHEIGKALKRFGIFRDPMGDRVIDIKDNLTLAEAGYARTQTPLLLKDQQRSPRPGE